MAFSLHRLGQIALSIVGDRLDPLLHRQHFAPPLSSVEECPAPAVWIGRLQPRRAASPAPASRRRAGRRCNI
jgi:hypothetical protein